MYPETVGRSLEEIEEIFQQGHVFSAWAIGRNIGKKTLDQVVSDKVSIRTSRATSRLVYSSQHKDSHSLEEEEKA